MLSSLNNTKEEKRHMNEQALNELQKLLGMDTETPEAATRQIGDTTYLDLELPGVRKEDIALDVREGVLTVTAEKKKPEGDHLYAGRWYGTYKTRYKLSSSVDTEAVAAAYTDGVLTVSLARKAGSGARKVAIT